MGFRGKELSEGFSERILRRGLNIYFFRGRNIHQDLFTSEMVCGLSLGDVIQDSVCLVACPVPGTPHLHYINRLELILEHVM